MDTWNKRKTLQALSLITLMSQAGLISPVQAREWNRQAFEGKNLDAVLKLIDATAYTKNSAVQFNAPDISENGAAVQIGVTSALKATEIAFIVEKNPNPLVGHFFLAQDAEPYLNLKIKIAQTSNVYALMRVEGKWIASVKEIRVTLGGCVA